MKISIRKTVISSVIAAIYVVGTVLLAPISYGVIQLRVVEALCVLPFFFPYMSWGLFIGCFLSNLMSTAGILDVVFGSLATLCSCYLVVLCRRIKNEKAGRMIACLPPVIVNALVVGAILTATTVPAGIFFKTFLVYVLQIGIGEAAVMLIFGLPLITFLPQMRIYEKISKE